MYNLAEILGLSGSAERRFRREIEQNERKILSGESISSRVSAEFMKIVTRFYANLVLRIAMS